MDLLYLILFSNILFVIYSLYSLSAIEHNIFLFLIYLFNDIIKIKLKVYYIYTDEYKN